MSKETTIWLNDIPPKISGIYKITNTINNKYYIGGAVNIRSRLRRHIYDLRHGKHSNIYLQRSFNKYGFNIFNIEIISSCEKNWIIIDKLENLFIEHLNPEYNLVRKASGIMCAEITKKKLSESHKEIQSRKSQELRSSYFKHTFKPVKSYNLLTKEIKYYDSIEDAARKTGVFESAIRRSLNKYNKQNKGLLFFNKDHIINKIQKLKSFRPVEQYSVDNKFIKFYTSVKGASKDLNINPSSISGVLNKRKNYNTAGGYLWREFIYYNG